ISFLSSPATVKSLPSPIRRQRAQFLKLIRRKIARRQIFDANIRADTFHINSDFMATRKAKQSQIIGMGNAKPYRSESFFTGETRLSGRTVSKPNSVGLNRQVSA